MAVTTLSTLWRMLADLLGPHQLMTVDTTPSGPDPGRWLCSSELAVTNEGAFTDQWYRVETDPVVNGRVLYEEPTVGALAMEVRQSVVIPEGTPFEVLWPLPVETAGGTPGLVSMIQQACREVWHEDSVDLTTVQGAYTYTLTGQRAWLDAESRVLDYLDPSVVSGYPPQSAAWRYGGLTFSAGSPTLTLADCYDQDGATAQLRVLRPAYSLVNGAESTSGPSEPTDTIAGDPSEIVSVALLHAYRYLARAAHLEERERQRYAAEVAPQQALVQLQVRHYLPRTEGQTSAPAQPQAATARG